MMKGLDVFGMPQTFGRLDFISLLCINKCSKAYQKGLSKQLQMVFFTRYLPIISFIVGSSALSFQVMVLYPWHNEIDAEFKRLKELKQKQDRRLEEYNSKKMDQIHDLEDKINHLIDLQYEKIRKAKEGRKEA